MSVEPVRHLQAVPDDLHAKLVEQQEIINVQNAKLNGAWSEIAKLRRQLSEAMAVETSAADILEVLTYWNDTAKKGRCKIVVGSERWVKVRDRLREKDVRTKERCFTPHHLKAAVAGALLSEYHVKHRYLDAVTIFRDSKTVESHIDRAVAFKSRCGLSALAVIDELAGEGLEWLTERCSCTHMWIEHLRSPLAAQGGGQACSSCDCKMFDTFHAKVERWIREHE